jgi:rare lipoprotein A
LTALGVAALLLQACGAPRVQDSAPAPGTALPPLPSDPVPRAEPRSRYGNPESYVVFGRRYHTLRTSAGYRERGIASWYGSKFHGRRTSSGETYDMHAMTAAHKTLPLPTYVEVTNLASGARIVARVNDRGPFHDNRIIDLSYAAARKLGIVREGTGLVEVRALTPGEDTRPVARAIPAATWSVAGMPRIYLQVGAFAERRNAQRLRTRLASLPGAVVRVQEVRVAGRAMYRVRVGPLDDVSAADRLSERIVDAGMELPRIVIE